SIKSGRAPLLTAPAQSVLGQGTSPQGGARCMGYISRFENSNGSIYGRSLAHRKISHWLRVRLAGDVASGACRYIPTDAEIAAAFKVSPSALSMELKGRTERGVKRNGDGAARSLVQAQARRLETASRAAMAEDMQRLASGPGRHGPRHNFNPNDQPRTDDERSTWSQAQLERMDARFRAALEREVRPPGGSKKSF